MKKFLTLVAIFSAIFSINVFADDSMGDWINWSPHIYNTYDNPLLGAGELDGFRPWYVSYSNEPSLGVVIALSGMSGNTPYNSYYYVSYNNTFNAYINYNNYGNNNHYVPNTVTYNLTRVTGSGPPIITGLINKFNITQPLYYCQIDQSQFYPQVYDNADIHCSSIDDLYSQMEQNNFQSGYVDPNAPDSNNLPMLQYGLTKNTVLGFPQVTQIKENLTWNYTTHDIYKNNPTDFHMEMVASARWVPSPTGIGNIRDTSDKSINQNCKVYITNGGCNISTNEYSWIYREIGKSLYAISGEPWDDNSGYFMYVRTVQDSTGKTSAWKVYNLAMNGLVIQEDTFIEPDGTQKPLPDSEKDIGNGQGVQPAKFDNDSSTSSDSDPTSIRYDEGAGNFNAGTVISTLKSTVNQITELPSILTQLLAFLPPWLTSLMVIGIGLAVTIGVVKMILH